MSTTTTTFMNLILPIPTVELGPEWAQELNDALESVDEHDHSSGKGVKIKPSGMDINANLDFQGFKAFDLFSTQYEPAVSPLSGASNANSVFVFDGDLYYVNGAGTAVQLTSGGSPVSTPGAVDSFERTSINGDLTISPSDTFVFISVDTSAPRDITLPLASSVSEGRIYIVKDRTGEANDNPISVIADGSDLIDGNSTYLADSNFGSWWFIGNGANAYEVA